MLRAAAGALALLPLAAISMSRPAAAFEGRYKAGTTQYEQAIVLRKSGSGLRGKANVATRGCVGEFEGSGRPDGNSLVLRASQDGRECRITLRKVAAGAVEVSEEGCLTFHGAACEFSGTYRQAR